MLLIKRPFIRCLLSVSHFFCLIFPRPSVTCGSPLIIVIIQCKELQHLPGCLLGKPEERGKRGQVQRWRRSRWSWPGRGRTVEGGSRCEEIAEKDVEVTG